MLYEAGKRAVTGDTGQCKQIDEEKMTLPQEIQLFLIITTLIIAGINVAKGKVSDQQKYLSAFSIVTCIGMVGYYYEFCAVALSDAYCAITLEYFYFCFAPVFLLHFIILYSDSKLNRIFVRIFTVYEIATYIIIIHSKIITGPFFRAIYVVKSQGTSYISIVPGILYRINDIVNLIWSIWLVYLTFNGYIKHKKENRPELLLINIGSIIPCVGYISDMLGTCGHYPSSIIYNILAEIIFEFIVFHYNMFDTVEQAKNDYIHDMDEGVVVTNANDESVFHNPAVEKIFTDVDWTDNVEISEDAIDFMKKNRAGFASNDRFYNWHCSDLINNGRCEGYIYTIIDVTDDYEYTNQLMTLKDEALRASRVKNIFIANTSHEIKTPINSILGMNEMISRKDLTPEIRKYSENIRMSGYSLLSLINDIMDLSKLEAGKLHIIQEKYDPDNVIYESVNMIRGMLTGRHLGLKAAVSPDMPSILFGDDIRIRQCIVNVLKYSVEHTEKGHIEINVSCLSNDTETKETCLKVVISDTGCGIKTEMLQHLFDSVTFLSSRQLSSPEEFSLGLSMTKSLIDMLGADIEVESEYGNGSSFTLSFPQKVIDDTPIGSYSEHINNLKQKNKSKAFAFTAPRAKILVIDDAEVNLAVSRALLKQFCVKIDTGSSGAECLKMITKDHYDIIFIDHMMPDLDGVETVKKIRGTKLVTSSTRIIAMTGNSSPDAEEFYLGHGFDGYITKPVEPSRLQEILFMNLPAEYIIKSDKKEGAEL